VWAELARVRDAAGPTPVLIFSALQHDTFADWRDRGFAGLISKPFDLDYLTSTVGARIAGP
jgi:hypothetical protein